MIVTTSNLLLGVTPTITAGLSSDDPAAITDPDFSTLYTSSDNNSLTIDFGSTQSINYVAVAGINIEGAKNFTSYVRVLNGSTVISTNQVQRNNCVVITFEAQSFSNLRIDLFNSLGNKLPSIRFAAAGTALTIPNGGETSGYNRQFLNRNQTNKTVTNQLAAPVAVLTKKISATGRLSLPNMTKAFSEGDWQTFLDFGTSNVFFIREQDLLGDITQNSSAYLCFELTRSSATAHSETRNLNNLSVSFKVFNGL